MRLSILSGVVLCAAVSLGSFTAVAQDKTPAEFYEDNTLELMVGYSAGGGYDTYARTVARHLGKHVPGTRTWS